MPMPSKTPETPAEQAEQGLMQYAYAYGSKPISHHPTPNLLSMTRPGSRKENQIDR